jgi:CheY-like chemotaxis protein
VALLEAQRLALSNKLTREGFAMFDEADTLTTTAALDRPGRTRHYEALANLRILVIDDDVWTREALFEVLRLTGARVELASCAADGLRLVDSWKPQVIVCDIAMPVENGYTFIRKLRARESGTAGPIPALALTALATEQDRGRARAAGFQLHLVKPIDIDRLREAVLELSKMILGSSPC